MLRSWPSSALATVQPPSIVPITFFTGTRTSSKRVSQKGDLPLISEIGATLTPGVSMSIRMKVMPSCFLASGFVRTRAKIQSERSA